LAVLVFIDESGDPGFKVDRGASPIFVAVTVIFEQDQHAAITQLAIEGSQARRIHKPEFKFSECGDRVRDLFFEAVRCCPFRVRAVLIRKEVIYSPRLKADRDRFYAHFVKSMMKYDSGLLANAKIISDGSWDREFRNNLNCALRQQLGQGVIKDLRFKNFRSDLLIRLPTGALAPSPDPIAPNTTDGVRCWIEDQRCLGFQVDCAPAPDSRRDRARTPYGGSSERTGDLATQDIGDSSRRP
jgi:hypothetical protein